MPLKIKLAILVLTVATAFGLFVLISGLSMGKQHLVVEGVVMTGVFAAVVLIGFRKHSR